MPQTNRASEEPDFEGAIQYAIGRLESELAPELLYHSVRHTRDSVLPAAARLAAASGVGSEESRLVQVAAAYHDIGMIEQIRDHELIGVRIAEHTLPGFGFSQAQIAAISDMIMATHWPQSPQNLLAAILVDADLDVLGREDFLSWGHCLRMELAAQGDVVTDEEWYRQQLEFLNHHVYFTEAARALRDAGKQANITRLEQLLSQRLVVVECTTAALPGDAIT